MEHVIASFYAPLDTIAKRYLRGPRSEKGMNEPYNPEYYYAGARKLKAGEMEAEFKARHDPEVGSDCKDGRIASVQFTDVATLPGPSQYI